MFTLFVLTLCAFAPAGVPAVIIPPIIVPQSPLSTFNNCSGNLPPPPVGYSTYLSSYGPQLLDDRGWETWTFETFLDLVTTASLNVYQWTRGDPASLSSNPNGLATFTAMSSAIGFSATVQGEFIYEEVDDAHFSISIGDNHLAFDGTVGTYGVWNITVNISSFQAKFGIDSVPPSILFDPIYNGVSSQLVDGYFTNIPITRGHVDGSMTYPSGYSTLPTHSVGTIKHDYAKRPIQQLLSAYTRGSSWVEYSSLNWYVAEGINSQKTEAAQLVIGDFADANNFVSKYEATNDPNVLKITNFGLNSTITFPGCDESDNNPYVLSPWVYSYGGALSDSAGGKFEYYIIVTDTSIWTLDQKLYVGNASQGILEVYVPPSNLISHK